MCVAPRRFVALLICSIFFASRVLCAQSDSRKAPIESTSVSPMKVEANAKLTTELSTKNAKNNRQRISDVGYPGRELDAEWRKAAAERIERHRKANLTVLVMDARGKAIKEADVSIRLKQHSFRFGTIVSVEFLPTIVAAPPWDATTRNVGKLEETERALLKSAQTPIAEMPAGDRFSERDRSIYREKLFALFNTASPRDESAAVNEQMTAWLRSRGFLFDEVPVQVRVVPAAFAISNLKAPETLVSDLKSVEEETDLPLAAERFSVAVDPESSEELQLQADYTRDFLTALFSIPTMREISIDGFWEPVSGVDGWALFEEDWSMRPVGKVYSDLLKRVWSTNEELLTDAAGRVTIRGFLGTYRISVVVGSRMKTITAVLPKDGAEIRVQMH